MVNSPEAEARLLEAERLHKQKQFHLAAKANKAIIESFPQTPWAEKALYNLGLIYIDSANPDKNYPQALKYFKEAYSSYPNGPLAQYSKSWIDILIIVIAQEIELDRLGRYIYNKERETARLNYLIRERDKEINLIKKKLEKYKQIDIELEEKEKIWKR
jgi:TPR repeat protein